MFVKKFYNNIDDMPIYNYFKVVNEHQMKYLEKKGGFFGNPEVALETIQRQLVAEFGLSEQFKEQIDLIQEICLLELELEITGDRFIKTLIKLRKNELKALEAVKIITLSNTKLMVERWFGFKVDMKKTTVSEWFSYLREINREQSLKNKN
jgi:hypothetical protein